MAAGAFTSQQHQISNSLRKNIISELCPLIVQEGAKTNVLQTVKKEEKKTRMMKIREEKLKE